MFLGNIMSNHFHCFSSLPTELRAQIWIDAISTLDDPAVFIYHPDSCTMTRKVYWDELPEHLLQFDYYYELSSPTLLLDGLLAASKESRTHALQWLERQDTMERWKCRDSGHRVLRSFDPGLDTLYIPLSSLTGFGTQLVDLLFQPENYEQRIGPQRTHLRRIAIPRRAFETGDYEILTAVAEYIQDLEVLYVVANYDDIDKPDDGVGDQFPRTRWELQAHRISVQKTSEIETRLWNDFANAQRKAAGFSFALDCLEKNNSLPFEIRLTNVAQTKGVRSGLD